MAKTKRKRTPPNRIPCTQADVNRERKKAADEGVRLSIAIFLSVLLDKEGYDRESLQRVWKHIEDRSDAVAQGYIKLMDIVQMLKDDYDVEVLL